MKSSIDSPPTTINRKCTITTEKNKILDQSARGSCN